MAEPARRIATYEDVLAAPPNSIAQLVGGELHMQPRPGGPLAIAATAVSARIPPFDAVELDLGPIWVNNQ